MAARRATLVKYPKKIKDIFACESFWNKLPSAHVCPCLPMSAISRLHAPNRPELVSTLHPHPTQLHVPLQPRAGVGGPSSFFVLLMEMTMAGTQSASIAKTAKMRSLAAGKWWPPFPHRLKCCKPGGSITPNRYAGQSRLDEWLLVPGRRASQSEAVNLKSEDSQAISRHAPNSKPQTSCTDAPPRPGLAPSTGDSGAAESNLHGCWCSESVAFQLCALHSQSPTNIRRHVAGAAK